MEQKEEEKDNDIDMMITELKKFWMKLTVKDLVIILLVLMMFLIYVLSMRDIEACNYFYQNLLRNMTRLTTSLW